MYRNEGIPAFAVNGCFFNFCGEGFIDALLYLVLLVVCYALIPGALCFIETIPKFVLYYILFCIDSNSYIFNSIDIFKSGNATY